MSEDSELTGPQKLREQQKLMREAFGRNLVNALKKAGLSQTECAKRCERYLTEINASNQLFARDRITQYVAGRAMPRGDKLNALCHVLNVAEEDLLADSELIVMPSGPATKYAFPLGTFTTSIADGMFDVTFRQVVSAEDMATIAAIATKYQSDPES